MGKQEAGYDYHRYKQLLAEAVDETRRLELIDTMIKEKARDRLEAQRISDRVAMTAVTVARVLGSSGRRDQSLGSSSRVLAEGIGVIGPRSRPAAPSLAVARKSPLLRLTGLDAGILPRLRLTKAPDRAAARPPQTVKATRPFL